MITCSLMGFQQSFWKWCLNWSKDKRETKLYVWTLFCIEQSTEDKVYWPIYMHLFSEPKFSWPSHSWEAAMELLVAPVEHITFDIEVLMLDQQCVKHYIRFWFLKLNQFLFIFCPRWPCPSNLGPSHCPSQGWTNLVLQSASFMWEFFPYLP